ncbi:hypothetical protein L6R53_10335 [Myxococcota bacterium]|nr:hypothetical protein [Myxococcota bacterium]
MSTPTPIRLRFVLLSACTLALLAAAGGRRKPGIVQVDELILSNEDGSVNFRLAVEGDALVLRRMEPVLGHIRFVSLPGVSAIEMVENATGRAQGRMWVDVDDLGMEFQAGPDQPSARLSSSAQRAALALRAPQSGGAVVAEVSTTVGGGSLQLGDREPAVRLSGTDHGLRVESRHDDTWVERNPLP